MYAQGQQNQINLLQQSSGNLQVQQRNKSMSQKSDPLVFSWGRNNTGQISIPSANQNCDKPTPTKGIKSLAMQIVSGHSHSVLLTKQGRIYVCGSSLFGRLGLNPSITTYKEFRELVDKGMNRIVKIACADYHNMALAESGVIYSWGGTLWDKTGHKNQGIVEIQKLKGRHIQDVACGSAHSVALDTEGKVYSWGGGGTQKNKGQLGHGNLKDFPQPEEIKFFRDKKVKKIACGQFHTMILTQSNELYAFGQGSSGQLGTGGKEDCSHPKKVKLNISMSSQQYFESNLEGKVEIQQIALGAKHSLILTSHGQLYVCGYGSQGQLGLGQGFTENCFEPTLVKPLLGKNIKMIAAGSNHSMVLTSKCDVFSCGHNSNGQLGIGSNKSKTSWSVLTKLGHKRVAKIFAGGQMSWAVIDQTQPIIQDYRPPSPIRLHLNQPSLLKETTSIRRQNHSFSAQSILYQLTSKRKLQLILTQTQMCHKFIHFTLKENIVKKKIDQYVLAVLDVERNVKYHKFSRDGEITDEKGDVKVQANPKGCTIMFVSPHSQENTQYNRQDVVRNKIPIGDIIMLTADMLKVDGKVPNHNFWFFAFSDMFDADIDKVRFIELRPKPQQ